MQLVLSNNRVLAHGENFLSLGGVVINTKTGAKYENATIAESENCPSDIDKVGYEYHAGVFVPCAPYGKGNGNVAVLCDRDCKAIKDSEIPLNSIGRIEKLSYTAEGEHELFLAFKGMPQIVFIKIKNSSGNSSTFTYSGLSFILNNGAAFEIGLSGAFVNESNSTDIFPLSEYPNLANQIKAGEGDFILKLRGTYTVNGFQYEVIAITTGE